MYAVHSFQPELKQLCAISILCCRISLSWKVNSSNKSGRRIFWSGCIWVHDADYSAGLHQV